MRPQQHLAHAFAYSNPSHYAISACLAPILALCTCLYVTPILYIIVDRGIVHPSTIMPQTCLLSRLQCTLHRFPRFRSLAIVTPGVRPRGGSTVSFRVRITPSINLTAWSPVQIRLRFRLGIGLWLGLGLRFRLKLGLRDQGWATFTLLIVVSARATEIVQSRFTTYQMCQCYKQGSMLEKVVIMVVRNAHL